MRREYMNSSRQKLPNLFIVGAAKSGTTSLYTYLAHHPDVYMCGTKEPNFFSEVGKSSKDRRPLSLTEYLALFKQYGAQRFIGEASPSYLWESRTAQRIDSMCPQAKIIVILRDPVERAYSHYLMDRQLGEQRELSFLRAIEKDLAEEHPMWWATHLYVALGMYYEQIRRYVDRFGENVLILFFEELRSAPETVLRRVASFLDIDEAGFATVDVTVAHNAYSAPRPRNVLVGSLLTQERFAPWRILPQATRHKIAERFLLKKDEKPPLIDAQAVSFLRDLFDPDIERLERFLHRPLPELRSVGDLEH